MKISKMVEVLQAAERGEEVQWLTPDDLWVPWRTQQLNFVDYQYRIAPPKKEKEMTMVEQLRSMKPFGYQSQLACDAADRIEDLEIANESLSLERRATDELLAELKRRVG